MPIRLNGSTSGYIELDAPASAPNVRYIVPQDFGFESGTAVLFQQSTAPTGWTKSTTHNDKALRVVSGAVSSGGVSAFSAVMNGSVGATTLTEAQIPSHSHNYSRGGTNTSVNGSGSDSGYYQGLTTVATTLVGGGGSHTHSINVAYVDVIIAVKD